VSVIIRKEQMEAFDLLGLEGHLVDHLHKFARNHIESIGNFSLRHFVRLGIQNAAGVGWTKRGPVEFFLEVMVMLGSEFLTDPQYPWAAASLRRPMEEMAGADRLHLEVMKYYDAVLGPGLCYEVEAIQRVLASEYGKDHPLSGMSEPEIFPLVEWAFPQKYVFVGPAAIGALVKEAKHVCAQFGVAPTGLALVTVTLFTFGHGCFSDPQYPWIAACMRMKGPTKETPLHRVFRKYLKEALTNMEQG
jgi:hypothetical protein